MIATFIKFRSLFIVFSSIIFLINLSGCSSHDDGGTIPRPVPAIRFQMLDGNYETIRQHRGKYVAVMFWESKCSFSKSAIREFNQYAKDHPQLVAYTVNLDKPDSGDQIEERIKNDQLNSLRHSYSGNEGYDEAYQYLRGDRIPHFFLINPSGTIVLSSHNVDDLEEYMTKNKVFQSY